VGKIQSNAAVAGNAVTMSNERMSIIYFFVISFRLINSPFNSSLIESKALISGRACFAHAGAGASKAFGLIALIISLIESQTCNPNSDFY